MLLNILVGVYNFGLHGVRIAAINDRWVVVWEFLNCQTIEHLLSFYIYEFL